VTRKNPLLPLIFFYGYSIYDSGNHERFTMLFPKNRPLNIAHRGARSLAPENTLSAGRKALEVGADMWEIDVLMTACGELLVIHDYTLVRTSNVRELFPSRHPWAVEEFTLEEIRQLDFGSWFNTKDPFGCIAKGWISPQEMQRYVGERAPTLGEALALTRQNDWTVNIEIKDLSGMRGHEEIVERVISLVEEMEMVDRVLISSFNHDYLRSVPNRNPGISIGALVERSLKDPLSLLQDLKARAYHPEVSTISPRAVLPIRDAGYEVLVWVANDKKTMQKLIASGASGIFTDFPQVLASLIKMM
jgi:glycerophosphoryl diester phosphodiesterase